MIRFVHRVAIVGMAMLLSWSTARAVTSQGPALTVPQLPSPPHVNGVIDASWNGAAKISLGFDYPYRRAASEPTTVYIAQSGNALYFA